MALIAPAAVEVGGWTLKKIAPWIILGLIIAGLGAALWVQTQRLNTARNDLKTMTADRDLQKASAQGWQAHSSELQKGINDLNDQVTRLAVDKHNAQVAAQQLIFQQTKKADNLSVQLQQMKARVNAHPDQAHPIGPIGNDVLDLMCGPKGAADPSATCD